MTRRRIKDEAGVTAIIFALSALLIFGLAAIGVDLGNAMNRRKQNQNSADLAALAGAGALPASDAASKLVVRQKVADYLNQNQPATDDTTCNNSAATITATQLADGDTTNGEVTFVNDSKITVTAPSTKVNFGMATAIGFKGTCVQTAATARISSGGAGFAPYYATSSCSSGPQVLKSDAGGQSIPFTVPPLANDTDTNTSVLSSANPNPNPNSIPLATVGAADGPQVSISGTNLGTTTIDKVGFFNTDRSAPVQAGPVSIPAQIATNVTVLVPNAVASVQDVWWVRVHDKTTGKWSTRSEAVPLLVGDAVLSCDPNSVNGNFGAIDFPAFNNNPNKNITAAIQSGPPPPMSLKQWPNTTYPQPCDSDPLAVISTSGSLKPDTNCVQSTTGLHAQPAYDGYLDSSSGNLIANTSSLCQSQGRPTRQALSTGESVNADLLTCFLKNDTLKLSDAINFVGGSSPFVSDLWKSPRFVLVPVVPSDPTGTKYLPIVRFVPGFICDEVTGASRSAPLESGQTENGLVTQNGKKLRAIRIVFFDFDALPPPPDGGALVDYIGAGPKVINLVN